MRKSTLALALVVGLTAPAVYAQEANGDQGADSTPHWHHHHHHHRGGDGGWRSHSDSEQGSSWQGPSSDEQVSSDDGAGDEGKRRKRRRRRHHHGYGEMAGGQGCGHHRGGEGMAFGGFTPDPQREADTMTFLKANYPEKARELEAVKADSPEIYTQAMFRMEHRVGFLQMMQQRDPAEFQAALATMKQHDRDLARQLQGNPIATTEPGTLRGRLHQALDQVCDMANPSTPAAAAPFALIAAGLGGLLIYRRRRNQLGLPRTETV